MVVCLYLCVTLNHHRFAVAYQSAQRQVFRQVQVFHLFAGDLRIGACHQLGHVGIGKGQELHVRHVGIQQELIDMTGGNQLLVDYRTDIHILGQRDIVDILDLGDCLEYAETFGSQASQDIRTRIVCQSDKRLCVFDPFLHQ